MQRECYTMFPIKSFFRNEVETRNFYEKLHDETKNMIIFVGAGGNGKTQMTHQILSMSPKNTYIVWREKDLSVWNEKDMSILPMKKKIICEMNVLNTKMIPAECTYDVVEFPKIFAEEIDFINREPGYYDKQNSVSV